MAKRRILSYTVIDRPAVGVPRVIVTYSDGTIREWIKGQKGYEMALVLAKREKKQGR